MKKRSLVRIQITLLVILVVLVVIRMITGPPDPRGLVVFARLEPYQLQHRAFELSQPAEVAVSATGSFEPAAVPAALAAYGWIVRRTDRAVVWRMDPVTATPGRGTAARVPGDTLVLEAGLYDAFFTTYGATYSKYSRDDRWRNDADQWQLVLRTTDADAPARALPDYGLDDLATSSPNLVKALTPLHDDRHEAYLFEVRRPVSLGLYAVGEIEDQQDDYSWIEDAATGQKVWEMTRQNTEPAGGIARNRFYRGEVPLAPGTYRAVAVTNDRHAYDDWEGNPPLDPAAWGLTLYADDAEAVAAFDPWTARTPLVSFTRVPDYAERSQRFEVRQPIAVVVYCVGEMTERNSIYDFGELLREEAGGEHTVWKMSYEASGHAGGASKNRLEVAFLTLEPGTYVLRYQTDDSHSYQEWNRERPDHPERWGVTLFPLAASLPADALRLLPDAPALGLNAPLSVDHDGPPLLAWTRLGGDVEEAQSFELDRNTRLHVVALGEITLSGQHDYGWIERDGEKVWQMTLENTRPAGGTDRNRRFDAVITLPPGRYTARYRTDFSHHFGDFGSEFPRNPEGWGMTLYRVAGETAAASAGN